MELRSVPRSSLLQHNGKREKVLRKQALYPLEEIYSENTPALAEVILNCTFIWEFAIQNELQCFSQLASEVDLCKGQVPF